MIITKHIYSANKSYKDFFVLRNCLIWRQLKVNLNLNKIDLKDNGLDEDVKEADEYNSDFDDDLDEDVRPQDSDEEVRETLAFLVC